MVRFVRNSRSRPAAQSLRSPLLASEVIKTYKPALLVYAALRELAGGQRQFRGTRRTIAVLIKMDLKTITKSIKVLAEARWVQVSYGTRPAQARKWYRITFASDDFLPYATVSVPARSPGQKPVSDRGRPKTRQKAARAIRLRPTQGLPVPRVPETHAVVARALELRPTGDQEGVIAANDPKDHETDPRDLSLDPPNGSKGTLPLDPRRGSYSLKRVGGAPPGPPPALTLGSGPGTRPDIQGLGSAEASPQSNPCSTPQQPAEAVHTGNGDISTGIEAIIASLGADAGDPDESRLLAPDPPSGSQPSEQT